MLPQSNQNSNQFGNQRNPGNQFGNQGNQFGYQGNHGNQGSTQDQVFQILSHVLVTNIFDICLLANIIFFSES